VASAEAMSYLESLSFCDLSDYTLLRHFSRPPGYPFWQPDRQGKPLKGIDLTAIRKDQGVNGRTEIAKIAEIAKNCQDCVRRVQFW
jgi:hypothetical protein